jgi:predicted kinase
MPKADLAIYLDTDLDIILSRNKNRNNPEPEEFIKRRFEEIRLINIKAKNKMKFRNNKELKDATNDCLYFISKFINQ